MGNQEDFGIGASDIMRYINPSFSTLGWRPETLLTGTAGVGGNLSWTDTTANWKPSSLIGWQLLIDGTQYEITANTKTVITIASDLSAKSGAYEIGIDSYDLDDSTLALEIDRACALVKGEIPEKYRQLIYTVNGEILIKQANGTETTASLSYPTSVSSSLEIYRDLDITNYSKGQALTLDTDYTVSENQNITFTTAIGRDIKVSAIYTHALPTVPAMLKTLGVMRFIIELCDRNLIARNNDNLFNLEALRTQYKETIEALNAGKIGIAEFDKILLEQETRGTATSMYMDFWGDDVPGHIRRGAGYGRYS